MHTYDYIRDNFIFLILMVWGVKNGRQQVVEIVRKKELGLLEGELEL